MNRREAREIAFKLTYEMTVTGAYNPDTRDELLEKANADCREFVDSEIAGIESHFDGIKAMIVKYAKGYDYSRIYKADIAILIISCYEIMYTDLPSAVIANEAVELAKIYSDVKSYSFINGILASVIRERESNG